MDDHVSAINGSFLEKMFRAIVALAKSIHFAFKKIPHSKLIGCGLDVSFGE